MKDFGEFRISRPMAGQCAFGAEIFFWTVFWSTKRRVGDVGCAIFLFFKKTRHSIECPFFLFVKKNDYL